MSVRALNCAEIRAGFTAGAVPTGPRVVDHLRECSACRELFDEGARLGRSLAVSVLPQADAGNLFALVERDVKAETGLRARARSLPTWARLVAVLSLALASILWHAVFLPREELGGTYSPLGLWLLLGGLLAALLVGSRWLLRGVTSSAAVRGGKVALALLAVPVVVALLAPLGALHAPEALAAWGSPGVCFSYGALHGIPIVVSLWLFDRRDRAPLTALLAAGALAGIAANALLHAHCASANLPHLLLGHATIGAAWALGLSLTAVRSRARG